MAITKAIKLDTNTQTRQSTRQLLANSGLFDTYNHMKTEASNTPEKQSRSLLPTMKHDVMSTYISETRPHKSQYTIKLRYQQ